MVKLFNGDCLQTMKSKDFKELIKNKNACIVIDPPFNVGYHYNTYKDKLSEDEYYNFLKEILTMYDLPFVIIHYPESIYKLALKIGITPERVISWVYNSNTMRQHRDIAFFKIKPDMDKIKQPYKNLNDKRIRERIERGIGGGRLYDWWEIDQVKNVSKKGIDHPCVMPLEVMKRIVGVLPDDTLIIDCFMGSGTTGEACKIMDRDFIGIEIDHDYFKICDKRINELTLFDL